MAWSPVGAAVLSLAVVVSSACSGDRADPNGAIVELRLEPSRTVVTQESALLALVYDLAVDETGNLFALDVQDDTVVAVPPDGGDPWKIGRPGEGPGELQGPLAIGAGEGRLLVLEAPTGEVQHLDYDGNLLDTVMARSGGSWGDVNADGRTVVVDTVPAQGHLANVFDERGNATGIGELVVPPIWERRYSALQEQISAGEVPDAFRNRVAPALADNGWTWLFLQTEGVLRGFDAAGEPVASATFDLPEMDPIFEEYVRAARRGRVLYGLEYVADLVATGGRVWVLWNLPPASGALVTVHGLDARMSHRLVLPSLSHANSLAVDRGRGILYLSLEDRSAVVAVDLPAGLVSDADD